MRPRIPQKYLLGLVPAILILLLVSAGTAIAQLGGRELLEQKLQRKLDRILNIEEYLLDLRVASDNSAADASSDKFLPGLQVLGPVVESGESVGGSIILGGRVDLLLILDKKVSAERARVARDIVARTIEAEGLKSSVKFSAQQRDINKTREPPVTPPPPRDPSLFEQLLQEREFLSRVLLVFWGGLVSLMAVYFMLRRFLLRSGASESSLSPGQNASVNTSQQAPGVSPDVVKVSGKGEKTREELYSKDEALLNLIKEITEESKAHPQKAARILSRWVGQGGDLSRAAAVYLRNCDIKTVELVCQAMHPSDLEKITTNKIEDFEPFGAENQRVIERMRSDLAVLASEVVLRDRPDPLNFLRRLSDEEIRNLLDGETEETVALVASQLPAHRLQKFYDSVPPESVKAIVSKLSSLKSASVRDFESLQALLNHKIQMLSNNLVNEKELMVSIQSTITALASPTLQYELASALKVENPRVYEKVRPTILLPSDLRFLPARVKSLLTQSIDADTLGVALSGFRIPFDALLDDLPGPYQSVFRDAQARRSEVAVVNEAWRRVKVVLMDLISAGLISVPELTFTIRRAEESVQTESENPNASVAGTDRGAA